MSDGFTEVSEELYQRAGERINGFCFYHGQDLERAVDGGGLMLAYADLEDNEANKRKVGQQIRSTLEKHGFAVEWDGDLETRISVPSIDWKRRGPA